MFICPLNLLKASVYPMKVLKVWRPRPRRRATQSHCLHIIISISILNESIQLPKEIIRTKLVCINLSKWNNATFFFIFLTISAPKTEGHLCPILSFYIFYVSEYIYFIVNIMVLVQYVFTAILPFITPIYQWLYTGEGSFFYLFIIL